MDPGLSIGRPIFKRFIKIKGCYKYLPRALDQTKLLQAPRALETAKTTV